MPIYEFECSEGHRVERILSIERMQRAKHKQDLFCDFIYDSPACLKGEQCGLILNLVWSLPAKMGTPDDSRSNFTYYENEKGQVEFTSTPHQYHPKGFVKKEARNHIERLRIEEKIRKQDNERLERQRENQDIIRGYSVSERHAELRNAINQGVIVETADDGTKTTIRLDEVSKSLIKKGMKRTNEVGVKKQKSDFHFEVNHDNKSTIRNKE